MNLLRTPDERFAQLPGYAFAPRYIDDLPGLDGARVHYIDEGSPDASTSVLALHGNPSWSYLYRHMIPLFTGAGLRLVAPDLIGFGRSDKPVDEAWHSFERHRQMLLDFVQRLALRNVMLVCQDWGGILGLTLPMDLPEVFSRVLVMNTTLGTGSVTDGFVQWRNYSNSQPDLPVGKMLQRGKRDMSSAEAAGYDAPYPDASYKAALRAFPNLVPDGRDAPGADISRRAQAWLTEQWRGDSFMAIGQQDPVLAGAPMQQLRAVMAGCPAPLEVAQAGHFVPEWGAPIAQAAQAHFGLTPA